MRDLYVFHLNAALNLCLPQYLKETVSMETTEKKEDFLFNAYLLAGVIGFASAVILGIVSLPSVAKSLSCQEFRLIQVKIKVNFLLKSSGLFSFIFVIATARYKFIKYPFMFCV